MRKRRAQTAVRWVIVAASIFIAGAVVLGVVWLNRPQVTITHIVEGTVVNAFYATGTVQPATEYPIKTSNAGVITQLFVDKGDRVKVGQKLAIVEDPQLQFRLEKSTADLKQATERADETRSPVLKEFDAKIEANASLIDNAKRELGRLTDMSSRGGASKSDVDRAADRVKDLWSQGASLAAQRDAARLQLNADLDIARAAWNEARRNIELETLLSPIDGVVLDRPAPRGTRLNVNVNDHVMQLADILPSNLRMRAAVDEENIADVIDGQLVQMALYSFPGKTFEGKVTRRYPKADPDRRTFEVDIEFTPPDPRLAPGMTGELAFIIAKKDRALIAPAQALQGGSLYTLREGRLMRVDPVRIGIRSVERVEVLEGLRLDDPVVISPVQDLRPGAPVRVNTMDPAAAAGVNKASAETVRKNPLGDR